MRYFVVDVFVNRILSRIFIKILNFGCDLDILIYIKFVCCFSIYFVFGFFFNYDFCKYNLMC